MSGHSKWHKIRYQKASTDKNKGKIFSKLSKLISLAAKEKGGNPETNPKLRLAIEKAKKANMPKENIERAIKKGIGQLEDTQLEELTYEAYGPGGIAMIIEVITDNKNRTLNEIKHILSKYGGKLSEPGSVKYLFDYKGVLKINLNDQKSNNKENIEIKAIEAGAENIIQQENFLEVYVPPNKIEETKNNLKKESIEIDSSGLEWIEKNPLVIEKEETLTKIQKLFEELDEQEDVQEIYSNLKIKN